MGGRKKRRDGEAGGRGWEEGRKEEMVRQEKGAEGKRNEERDIERILLLSVQEALLAFREKLGEQLAMIEQAQAGLAAGGWPVQCTLYNILCTVYTVQCTVCTVQWTECTIHSVYSILNTIILVLCVKPMLGVDCIVCVQKVECLLLAHCQCFLSIHLVHCDLYQGTQPTLQGGVGRTGWWWQNRHKVILMRHKVIFISPHSSLISHFPLSWHTLTLPSPTLTLPSPTLTLPSPNLTLNSPTITLS